MNKYRAVATVLDGVRFHSKAEAKRYAVLKNMERAGEIEGLKLQPRYRLEIGGFKVCDYIGDFEYTDRRTGERITEDVKGVKTAAYRIKAKLMKALRGVEIREVK